MTEQQINEMALLNIMPLTNTGGRDVNYNYRLSYIKGAKDCNSKWEEKLIWISTTDTPNGKCIVRNINGEYSIFDFSDMPINDIKFIILSKQLVEWRTFF